MDSLCAVARQKLPERSEKSDVLVMGAGRLEIVVVPWGTGGLAVARQKALRTQGTSRQNCNAGGRSSIASGPWVWNCSSVWHKVGVPAATVFLNTPTFPARRLVSSLFDDEKFPRVAPEGFAVICHRIFFFPPLLHSEDTDSKTLSVQAQYWTGRCFRDRT